MASRRFFYDDCRSATRLSREYTKTAGADNLVVEFQSDIGKYAYSLTRSGGSNTHRWTINSFPSTPCFEAYLLSKKTIQAPHATEPCIFGFLTDVVDVNNLVTLSSSDALYIGKFTDGAYKYKYWGKVTSNDVWYAVKWRKMFNIVQGKIWQYGTSEPNWQYTQEGAPLGSNQNPVRLPFRPGVFGLDSFVWAAGDNIKVTDIRITPLRCP